MDRVVCLIVLTVVASLVLEFSGAAPQPAPGHRLARAQAAQPAAAATGVQGRADVELVEPVEADTARTIHVGQSQRQSQRSSLFDNIFKVSTAARKTQMTEVET